LPEYPEELVREVINNSLAHRDYSINKFVTVTVEPGRHIEIKNPGSFKDRIKLAHTNHEIPIRRLIPGIPESKNPKLAAVLKVFEKVESQGRGMASLVNHALANHVDLPYYELKDDETISLTIPGGKLLDEECENWLLSFEKFIIGKLKGDVTHEHKLVLTYFRKSELLNRRRLFTILLTESNNHFQALESLRKSGLIYEHPAGSDNSPVYILDRELMKDDFTDELIDLLGQGYVHYDEVTKNILNIIYRFTKYNGQPIKPAVLTPEIYNRLNGKNIDPRKYETLGRKVRRNCRELHARKILNKNDSGAYTINFSYHQSKLV